MEDPRHSVASETTLESTNDNQSCHTKKKKYTPEQQLASQSSMSVNCAD